jgi:hypothetical protein
MAVGLVLEAEQERRFAASGPFEPFQTSLLARGLRGEIGSNGSWRDVSNKVYSGGGSAADAGCPTCGG